MHLERVIPVVDYHTEGHPARIILGGIGPLPGRTMAERSEFFGEHLDHLRRFILYEPRGHSFMAAMLLTPPIQPEAHMGMLVLEIPGMAPMCGHGTIAAVAAIVETGMVEARPFTEVVLDTPAGLVRTSARVEEGRAHEVTVENVPAFPVCLGAQIIVNPYGKIEIDVAYGGDYYAILPADRVGLNIVPAEKDKIVATAAVIRRAIAEQLVLVDPVTEKRILVTSIQFWAPPTSAEATLKNTVAFPPDQVDRSPCGTGTCARMATLVARGELKVGQSFVHESITGTLFRGRVTSETRLGNVNAIVPRFSGRAYITGIQQMMLTPSDPFPSGYLLPR
jgi:proline racemase